MGLRGVRHRGGPRRRRGIVHIALLTVGVAIGASSAACGGAQAVAPPPPGPPPSAAVPVMGIPSDLDVIVRVDLDPIRAVLPAGAESRLAAVLQSAPSSSTAEIVRHALQGARQVWIGWRPGSRPEQWDNVIVMRGDFSSVAEGQLLQAFHPAESLGGGWRSYTAREVPSRAAPARIYTHLDDLWIVASAAELDAVDRILEGRATEERLEPPERGVISFAARLSSVSAQLREQAPKAAKFLRRARTAQGSADLTSVGLDLTAELEFEAESDAERAAQALQLLLHALALQGPSWLDDIKVSCVATSLGLRARIPHQMLSRGMSAVER